MKKLLFVLFAFFLCVKGECINSTSCYVFMKGDTLYVGNTLIERTYLWNRGNIITNKIIDKHGSQTWINKSEFPDFYIPYQSTFAINTRWTVKDVESSISPYHKELTIEYTLDKLQVKRVYCIYPNCPAIAIDTYLKGVAKSNWTIQNKNLDDIKHIESLNVVSQQADLPVLDQVSLQGNHWEVQSVEFFDITDYHNTLVKPCNMLAYNDEISRGNLLFFHNMENEKGLFFLKEAPCSAVQLSYPGADFITSPGRVKCIGIGMSAADLRPNDWVRAYSIVMGVYSGNHEERLLALRNYQKNQRKLIKSRDEMIMMNTWGDRRDITRLKEDYCLREIEKCSQLGINCFQLDDGWQEGADTLPSYKDVYKNPDYWTPNKKLFPKGLTPLVKRGNELGVKVALFLNPSFEYSNNDWQKDADSMIRMYKEYGIRNFKIDGVLLTNKLAETRFREMLDKVMQETNNEMVIDFDITAGQRGGYFCFNKYGNIFLENRYTDWGNYYPYRTLRNLWMLAEYVPAERLQVEFLNNWRKHEMYVNDPFAPANYSFEYLFATTMAAQPLAWFDAADLPPDAFAIKNLIGRYRSVQYDFHEGYILPIGEEPSGKSWTGFQSIKEKEGYLLIYREENPSSHGTIKTYLEPHAKVTFTPILGTGKKFVQQVAAGGYISVFLPNENSFVMYKYKIN
jgi:hypothetical protein